MKDKFLPIGTVVLLKGATKKVMITNYLIYSAAEGAQKKMYDYGACTFPEGIIDSDAAIGFNHDEIAEVVYVGYENDEQKEFNAKLLEKADEIKTQYENQ